MHKKLNILSRVIITGVSGQDGSYMCDYLVEMGYDVYGSIRHSASPNTENYEHLLDKENFTLCELDLSDDKSVDDLVKKVKPDYFINFAAHAFVGNSWRYPEMVMDVNAIGVIRQLEAIKEFAPKCRYYNAGTSEEMGDVEYSPQDENHPARPRSPYGASKVAARSIVKVYRDSFDLFAIQGWLYNHESPRRGISYVTKKIAAWAAKAQKEVQVFGPKGASPLFIGNLEARRDWSDARDFVRAIWSMVNLDEPIDYVVSSGETRSVREFLETSMDKARVDYYRVDSGEDTGFVDGVKPAYVGAKGEVIVYISKEFYRPAEVDTLQGDSSRFKEKTGWKPEISFGMMVDDMVSSEIKKL